ncbi:hypothetical protein PR048_020682 [Dryococelus australis]|uniref:Uncharacterized protein n=1 Tax=Dryococelus australis TaxID=614101 RepID=A0ABQ9H6Y8_9NEOP|nr:hypothetical protein PR048_020682 [Dryococelus australis]
MTRPLPPVAGDFGNTSEGAPRGSLAQLQADSSLLLTVQEQPTATFPWRKARYKHRIPNNAEAKLSQASRSGTSVRLSSFHLGYRLASRLLVADWLTPFQNIGAAVRFCILNCSVAVLCIPICDHPIGSHDTGHAYYTTQVQNWPGGGGRELEIPEKTRRPTVSSGTIPSCENLVTRPGIEPGSPWWEASVLTARPSHSNSLSKQEFQERAVAEDVDNTRIPPGRTSFHSRRGLSRIFAGGNHFPRHFNFDATPYSLRLTLLGSQGLDVKGTAYRLVASFVQPPLRHAHVAVDVWRHTLSTTWADNTGPPSAAVWPTIQKRSGHVGSQQLVIDRATSISRILSEESVWPAGWIMLLWNAIAAFVFTIHDTSHYDTTLGTAGTAQELVTHVRKFIIGTKGNVHNALHQYEQMPQPAVAWTPGCLDESLGNS